MFQRLGLTAEDLRVDRLLAEVHATGGDPLKLTEFFGIAEPTAIRYCLELGPLDQAADIDAATPAPTQPMSYAGGAMQISTRDGTAVTLQPRGWEFPDTLDEDDAQWLVISGHVAIGDRHWTFTHPCLLIGEAHELAGWLRAAADGTLEPTPAPESPEDDGPQLRFLEPLLGFSLAAHTQDEVVVRAYFAHGAAPPWADEAVRFGAGEIVELRVQPDVLTAAAAEWTNHLEALPARR